MQITYETLFDLLRKERSLDELQPLQGSFWMDVVEYLKERSQFLESKSALEQEKYRMQFTNIKRILKEIYERREQKIVNLALNVIRTDTESFVDKKNMLAEEKSFFSDVLSQLDKYKKAVLLEVFEQRIPTILPEYLRPNTVDAKEESSSTEHQLESSQQTHPEQPTQKSVEEHEKKSAEEQLDDSSSQEADTDTLLVKFTTTVPKFMGKNNQIFGPFQEGAIATLPKQIADILLKKGKAQQVMGS